MVQSVHDTEADEENVEDSQESENNTDESETSSEKENENDPMNYENETPATTSDEGETPSRRSERTRRFPARFREYQCQPRNCGRCKHCRDKPQFGGRNQLKQKCLRPIESTVLVEEE